MGFLKLNRYNRIKNGGNKEGKESSLKITI